MCAEENDFESFEEMVRSIAREVSRSAERISQIDIDEIAESIGVDPLRAREWIDSASTWLRGRAQSVDDDLESWFRQPGPVAEHEDPLRSAAPHPMDLPTDEQGVALAALDSGRWAVEPGSRAIATGGEGPGPKDALGLIRELHVRDWITADGEVTLVGRHALSRWLDAAGAR
jgi:hypothetical protein